MRRLLFALLISLPALGPACSTNGGASTPPPTPATTEPVKAADTTPAPADDGAGFAHPDQVEDPPREPAPEVAPELAEKIRRTFGEKCRYERSCGDMIGVDCESAVDGPYYYVRRDTLAVVSTCGGTCRLGCTDCPPKAWTCPTY
jgi:hypothetical protein